MSAPAQSSSRWLYGPVPDLLLGCGLGYFLVFALLVLAGSEIRQIFPATLAPLLLLVSGTPHYGATLLRVYERREDRRAYLLFAVHATLLVAAAFVAGLHSIGFGSLLLTIYLTWSPWHYTGQNYGIALLLLGRRGVAIDATTKRLVHLSFVLSYVLVFLAIHGASSGGADYAPVAYENSVYRLLPLGIPAAIARPALVAVACGWLVSGAAAALRLRRRAAAWSDLLPAAAVASSQALWFAAPVLARHYQVLGGVEPFSVDQAAYAFLWVAVAHSVQYLWITSYYARRSGARSGERWSQSRYLLATLLAGSALWTLPGILFGPALLGTLPYDAGLAVMITAAVNLHHFILDGAIWKLRDGRIARVLLRSADAPPGGADPGRRGWLRPLVGVAGIVGVVATVVAVVETDGVTRAVAHGDAQRLREAESRLQWLGRSSPTLRAQLAVLEAQQGDVQSALQDAQASLDLYPTADGWRALGDVHWLTGEPGKAIEPWRHALELRPGWVDVLNNLAWVRATHPTYPYRNSGEAVRLAEQAAAATHYQVPEVLDTLGAAYASAGRYLAALRVTQQAIALAEAQSRPEAVERLRGRLERYRAGLTIEDDPASAQWMRTRPANPSS